MVDSIQATIFSSNLLTDPLWTGEGYLAMELLATLVDIALLKIALDILKSFGENIREEAVRSKEVHRSNELIATSLQGERLKLHFRLEDLPPRSPTELSLYTPI